MNSLFNSALKQSSSVKKELDAFAEAPTTYSPALQGQISASLTSLSRTVDEYNNMAKREMIAAKQEKAYERVKTFRAEIGECRQQFEHLKAEREESQATVNRTELLGRRPHHAATPENPYAESSSASQHSPFRPANASAFGAAPADYNRETHALREQTFFEQTNTHLDEFLERGRAVLGDLGQQREMLKGTQRKLYSIANTLGVSGDTIRMVERRATEDKWIFYGGVLGFFLFCYLVIHFLR
ncbi:MAG: protein transport protein bos1 [Thelocarpon superellum]|nr:MAG: protein transport protein bos1 [Thelocarpon superellum]